MSKSIQVVLDGYTNEYQATGWLVDEFGHLHLIGEKGSGNVATYRAGAWQSVCLVRDDTQDVTAGTAVAEAINRGITQVAARGGR